MLSVLVANYNHAAFITNAIDAIAKQSYPTEIIIVDDGSTDNSVEVINNLIARYDNIKFFRNEKNEGAVFTANRALKESTGEYVYWGSADDMVLDGMFEKSIRALEEHPEAGLVCSIPAHFYEPSIVLVNESFNTPTTVYLSPKDIIRLRKKSHRAFNINGHTSIFRRSSLIKAGSFREDLEWHNDWFAVYVIAGREGVCFVPEPLAAIRVSNTSYSLSAKVWKRQRIVVRNVLRLLDTDYQDVAKFFKQANLLGGMPGIFGIPGSFICALSPRWWKYISLTLCAEAAHGAAVWIRQTVRNLNLPGTKTQRQSNK